MRNNPVVPHPPVHLKGLVFPEIVTPEVPVQEESDRVRKVVLKILYWVEGVRLQVVFQLRVLFRVVEEAGEPLWGNVRKFQGAFACLKEVAELLAVQEVVGDGVFALHTGRVVAVQGLTNQPQG